MFWSLCILVFSKEIVASKEKISIFFCSHINKWLKFLQTQFESQVQKILSHISFQQPQTGTFLELSGNSNMRGKLEI